MRAIARRTLQEALRIEDASAGRKEVDDILLEALQTQYQEHQWWRFITVALSMAFTGYWLRRASDLVKPEGANGNVTSSSGRYRVVGVDYTREVFAKAVELANGRT